MKPITQTLAAEDLVAVGLAQEQDAFVSSVWLRKHDTQILQTGGTDRHAFIGAWWPTNSYDAEKQAKIAYTDHTPRTKRYYEIEEALPQFSSESMVLPWSRNEQAEQIVGDHRFGAKDGLISIYSSASRELRLVRVIGGELHWWWIGVVADREEAVREAEASRIKHVISTEHFFHYEIDEENGLAPH